MPAKKKHKSTLFRHYQLMNDYCKIEDIKHATYIDARQSSSDQVGVHAHLRVIVDAAIRRPMSHKNDPRMLSQILFLGGFFQIWVKAMNEIILEENFLTNIAHKIFSANPNHWQATCIDRRFDAIRRTCSRRTRWWRRRYGLGQCPRNKTC